MAINPVLQAAREASPRQSGLAPSLKASGTEGGSQDWLRISKQAGIVPSSRCARRRPDGGASARALVEAASSSHSRSAEMSPDRLLPTPARSLASMRETVFAGAGLPLLLAGSHILVPEARMLMVPRNIR